MGTSPHPGTYRKKERRVIRQTATASDFTCLLILGGPNGGGAEIPRLGAWVSLVQVQKGEVVRSRQGGADVERSKALAHEAGF